MPCAQALVRETRAALEQAGLYNRNELNVLFETALGARPEALPPDKPVDPQAVTRLRALIARRTAGEPLQYIAGSWPFLDFTLAVGPGVLIPRPETEQLALRSIALLRGLKNPRALELCSGSGCVAIALKRALPRARIAALELSAEALSYLRRNAAALCDGLEIVQGDVFRYQAQLAPGALDLICANPPYVTPADYEANRAELAQEPRMAFIGGQDGLDFYRYIVPAYRPALRPGGALLFETGFDQTEAVAALLRGADYERVEILRDPFGLPRNVLGYRPRG